MENVNKNEIKSELLARLQDVFDDVKMSSTLLESGKEVFAHRQLQGVRTKLTNLILWCSKDFPEKEEEKDVAETTPET